MFKQMTRRSFLKLALVVITGALLYPVKALFSQQNQKKHNLKEAKYWKETKTLAG